MSYIARIAALVAGPLPPPAKRMPARRLSEGQYRERVGELESQRKAATETEAAEEEIPF